MHSMSAVSPLNSLRATRFPNFGSMETFRRAVIEYLDGTYQSFVAQYLDKSDYLFTISLAQFCSPATGAICSASCFLSNEYGSRTVPQIISSPWNRRGHRLHGGAVRAHRKGSRSRLSRRAIFHIRHRRSAVRRFTYCGENELRQLLRGAIRKFCAKITQCSHLKKFGEKTWSSTHKTKKIFGRLKNWLCELENAPLEEMGAFFRKRLPEYEARMTKFWGEDYKQFARAVPESAKRILDLGCGTGLELDALYNLRTDISVIGIDLSPDMLDALMKKHGDKGDLTLLCGKLLCRAVPGAFDAVISFESLHSLSAGEKRRSSNASMTVSHARRHVCKRRLLRLL